MQAEFTTAWKAGVDPDATAEELEQLWKSIDADGDGNLTVDELAKHFGFDAKSENSNEMSDEQILAALQLSMAVDEAASAEKKKLAEAEAAAKKEAKKPARDSTLCLVNIEHKKPNPSPEEQQQIDFLEVCSGLVGACSGASPSRCRPRPRRPC